jgi:hypothetical protein
MVATRPTKVVPTTVSPIRLSGRVDLDAEKSVVSIMTFDCVCVHDQGECGFALQRIRGGIIESNLAELRSALPGTEMQSEGEAEAPVGFKRPRKVDDDTITYLRGLEIPLKTEEDAESRELLVENMFEEVKSKEASLATHRKCSFIMETAVRVAPPAVAVTVAQRLLPYAGFLATDRYGSHVLQTVIASLVDIVRGESSSVAEAERVQLELFQVLVREAFWDLAFEQSGAHVLRELLSGLSGASAASPSDDHKKRGTAGKGARKHHTPGARHAEGAATSSLFLPTPQSWADALADWCVSLAKAGTEQLVSLAGDGWATGFLTHALAVWRQSVRASKSFLNRVSRRKEAVEDVSLVRAWFSRLDAAIDVVCLSMLGWSDPPSLFPDESKTVGVSTDEMDAWIRADEPRIKRAEKLMRDQHGSRVAEACLRQASVRALTAAFQNVLLPRSDLIASSTSYDSSKPDLLVTLSTHPHGNFVVQAALAATTGAEGDGSSLPKAPLVSEATVAGVVALVPMTGKILKAGRDGVLWRLAQAAAVVGQVSPSVGEKLQATLLRSITAPSSASPAGGPPSSRLAQWLLDVDGWRIGKVDGSEDETAAAAASSSSSSKKKQFARGVHVSAMGVRFVETVITSFISPLQRPLVESLAAIPTATLLSIARSPMGSRHLFEPCMSLKGSKLSWIPSRLAQSLKGCWADMAQDRMASWVVSRAFDNGDMRIKEKIASALVGVVPALHGTPYGRKLLAEMKLPHFQSDRASWKASILKQAKKAASLRSLVEGVDAVVSKASRKASEEARLESDERGLPRNGEQGELVEDVGHMDRYQEDGHDDDDHQDNDMNMMQEEKDEGPEEEKDEEEEDEDEGPEEEEDEEEEVEDEGPEEAAEAVEPAPKKSQPPVVVAVEPTTVAATAEDSSSGSDFDEDSAGEGERDVSAMLAPLGNPFKAVRVQVQYDSDSDNDAPPRSEPVGAAMTKKKEKKSTKDAIRAGLAAANKMHSSSTAVVEGDTSMNVEDDGAMSFLFGGSQRPAKSSRSEEADDAPSAKRAKVEEEQPRKRGKRGGKKHSK